MRRRTTFIDVYRYRKNRHAVLSRRGASIASHFAMRRSGVRSPSAPPPQAPTLSRQCAYCRRRCRTSLGHLVLLVGKLPAKRLWWRAIPATAGARQCTDAGKRAARSNSRCGRPTCPPIDPQQGSRALPRPKRQHFAARGSRGRASSPNDASSRGRAASAIGLERSRCPCQKSPRSRANTRILFAGSVISAEVGKPSHAGPSTTMPPGLPCAFGLNHWS